ncbi:hypothetical protein H0H81_006277 [Sphagnurus paluster]|uniref:Uncharacterized protein n=1 Tax=Sphagnurus paluster TaxID=117069 RepID=A0A9P7GK49_9AGAR|nr:hypothetical protein H0H81_006277 [Sphagnurus paluster]
MKWRDGKDHSNVHTERAAEERLRAEEEATATAAEAAKREAEEKAAAIRKEREAERAAAMERARLQRQREEEGEAHLKARATEKTAPLRAPFAARAASTTCGAAPPQCGAGGTWPVSGRLRRRRPLLPRVLHPIVVHLRLSDARNPRKMKTASNPRVYVAPEGEELN